MLEFEGYLTPIKIYKNITVVPYKKHPTCFLWGGPIYPDWENNPYRFIRGKNKYIDCKPEYEEPVKEIKEAVAWGGVITNNFGHFIAETVVPRLLPLVSTSETKDLKILVGIQPGLIDIKSWMLEIFEYFGIKKDRIILVKEPIKVRELFVPRAVEILNYGVVEKDIEAKLLDILDEFMFKNLKELQNVKVPKRLFVSRLLFPNKILGEVYLVKELSKYGYSLFIPENFSIKYQLHCYKNAEELIFSEGSAIHGLQLLGRLPQTEVTVINRRKGSKIAAKHLTFRVKRVRYIDSVAIDNVNINSNVPPSLLFGILDVEKFNKELGTNLSKELYTKYVEADFLDFINHWTQNQKPISRDLIKVAQQLFADYIKSNLSYEKL